MAFKAMLGGRGAISSQKGEDRRVLLKLTLAGSHTGGGGVPSSSNPRAFFSGAYRQ